MPVEGFTPLKLSWPSTPLVWGRSRVRLPPGAPFVTGQLRKSEVGRGSACGEVSDLSNGARDLWARRLASTSARALGSWVRVPVG